jgi:pimeloyl-ACP methyl ester carboxylesterase
MKVKKILAIGTVILVAGIYLYPAKKFTFEENYPARDEVLSSLQAFRQEPTQRLLIGEHTWIYHSAGAGDTAIVFLHGMGGSYDIWWQQVNYFKAKYRTVSLSYPPVSSLRELSDGVIAILNREKINNVFVVGSSLGGYLAQYLAVNHPGRVMKASLGNTFCPNNIQKAKNERTTKLMRWVPEWYVIKTIRKKYNAEIVPAANNSPVVKAFLNELLGAQVDRKTFLARYQCVVDPFVADISPSIPLQIIQSDNDPLVESALRDMLTRQYPKAHVVALKHAGHFPYLNEADNYNKILEQFLQQPGKP